MPYQQTGHLPRQYCSLQMQHGYHENYQDLQEVSHKRTLQSRVTAALQILFGSKMAVLQGSFGSTAFIELQMSGSYQERVATVHMCHYKRDSNYIAMCALSTPGLMYIAFCACTSLLHCFVQSCTAVTLVPPRQPCRGSG